VPAIKGLEGSQRRNVRASTTPAPANQPPEHPTRTCEHWNLTYCCALRGQALGTISPEKSNRHYRAISTKRYLLQRPLPASTAAQHHDTRHHQHHRSKVCATKHRPPVAKWITEALLLSIARPCLACLRVSARKEARQTVLPWCRRKTPPLHQ
jgi:hypothetical protein